MKHIFSLYPGGAAGAGLLLLRLNAVLLLVDLAGMLPPAMVLGIGILAAALALGVWARIATLLSVAAVGTSFYAGEHLPPIHMAGQICSLLALGLLGPGAFSIDARKFGRKVIHLP